MQIPESLTFQGHTVRAAREEDIPALRRLVNEAYKELGDRGLNYTAVSQNEEETRRRISQGHAFVVELYGEIVATATLKVDNRINGKNTAYVNQVAVTPDLKRRKLGSMLMELCETMAKDNGFQGVQLDTAKPAEHLVAWYLSRGYQIIGDTQFDGKTYESWIFEKPL